MQRSRGFFKPYSTNTRRTRGSGRDNIREKKKLLLERFWGKKSIGSRENLRFDSDGQKGDGLLCVFITGKERWVANENYLGQNCKATSGLHISRSVAGEKSKKEAANCVGFRFSPKDQKDGQSLACRRKMGPVMTKNTFAVGLPKRKPIKKKEKKTTCALTKAGLSTSRAATQ